MASKISGRKVIAGNVQKVDIFFVLLHYVSQLQDTTILFDTGSGNKKRLPQLIPTIARVGDTWDVPDAVYQKLEELTCSMYGNPRFSDINQCRLFKLKEKCDDKLDPTNSVDMGSLPPCQDCLHQHTRRVNYQVAIWKQSHIPLPTTPEPTDGHGWTLEEGTLEPLWTSGEIIPPELVNILQETMDESRRQFR